MYSDGMGNGEVIQRGIFSVPGMASGGETEQGFDPRDLNKDGVVDETEERELEDSFEEALDRDQTRIKKEMGAEGLRAIREIEQKYASDPYMLNVKVQDMSDTLILTAFGREREGAQKR